MWFVVAASVAFGLGGALMRWSAGVASAWPTVGFMVLFLAGALLLGRAVRSEGLAVAYLAGLGLEALLSLALGRYVFNERLTPPQAIGILLIAAGIATVRFG